MNPGGIEAEICVRIRHQRLEVVLLFHESLYLAPWTLRRYSACTGMAGPSHTPGRVSKDAE